MGIVTGDTARCWAFASGALLSTSLILKLVQKAGGNDFSYVGDDIRLDRFNAAVVVMGVLSAITLVGSLYKAKQAYDKNRLSENESFTGFSSAGCVLFKRMAASYVLSGLVTSPVFFLLHGIMVNPPAQYPGAAPTTEMLTPTTGAVLAGVSLLVATVSCCGCLHLNRYLKPG